MELSEAQKNDIVQIGRSAVDTADWYLKMCYGVETDKKGKDMFGPGVLETAQMVMGMYQKQGEQESLVSRLHEFEFKSVYNHGQLETLSGMPVQYGSYVKYSDGKNWADFTREELEYMATQSCSDVPMYKMSTTKEEQMQSSGKDNSTFDIEKLQLKQEKIRVWDRALSLAEKIPYSCVQELIDNTERIRKYLEGRI